MKKALLFLMLITALGTRLEAQAATSLLYGASAPFSGILVPEDMMKTFLNADVELAKINYELKITKELLDTQQRFYSTTWLRSPELNRLFGFACGVMVGVYLMRWVE